MKCIYIQRNYITEKKYKSIIENLNALKYVDIEYFDQESFPDNPSDKIIVCDKKHKIQSSHENIISAIKHIFKLYPKMTDKMKIMKDICKNIPVIIFSCGPSANTEFDKLKQIENDYIIMAIKYSRDLLLDNDLHIDFTIQSFWKGKNQAHDDNNVNESNTISAYIKPAHIRENPYGNDILFSPRPNGKGHYDVFKYIEKTRDINVIKFNDQLINNDCVFFNLTHIMLEVAIPLSIHVGCKHIYTFGWDGHANDNTYKYYDNTKSVLTESVATEFKIMKTLHEMFKNNSIYLYKCDKSSPIELPYENIYT